MKKKKISEISTVTTHDLAKDYLLMHRQGEDLKKSLYKNLPSMGIEKGIYNNTDVAIPYWVTIKTNVNEKSTCMVFFEVTIHGYYDAPRKLLIQGYEYNTFISFKALPLDALGKQLTIGHYLENGKRCFYIPVGRFYTCYVKAFHSVWQNKVVDFTLEMVTEKPNGTEITIG